MVNIRAIKGKEGYFADADGNIYSLWINKGYHGLVMQDNFKKLNFSKAKSGHMVVRFGRGKANYVHRVIYETFVGDINENNVIRHLNDDPSDNRVSNLAQGTQKDNVGDACRNGLIGKLSSEDVIRIRSLKGFKKRKETAKEFGVSEGTIKDIWSNKTWRWLN